VRTNVSSVFVTAILLTARPSLFIKDEDVRLSFLYGNYTTMTSITEDEMRRIVEQRLSPQYVSVHATDLDVRAYMLGVDKQRADISTKLARLLDAGIEVHAQVVLCPGNQRQRNIEEDDLRSRC
jgi:NifB/MoaA-like Fe-S oxidoreductase